MPVRCTSLLSAKEPSVKSRRSYPTDLSDEEWAILQPLVPEAKPGGRPRAHHTRESLEAIFYVLRGGCAWRLLPTTFHLGKPLTTTSGLGASTVAGRRSTLLSARANAS
jgi:hypothetical protein